MPTLKLPRRFFSLSSWLVALASLFVWSTMMFAQGTGGRIVGRVTAWHPVGGGDPKQTNEHWPEQYEPQDDAAQKQRRA